MQAGTAQELYHGLSEHASRVPPPPLPPSLPQPPPPMPPPPPPPYDSSARLPSSSSTSLSCSPPLRRDSPTLPSPPLPSSLRNGFPTSVSGAAATVSRAVRHVRRPTSARGGGGEGWGEGWEGGWGRPGRGTHASTPTTGAPRCRTVPSCTTPTHPQQLASARPACTTQRSRHGAAAPQPRPPPQHTCEVVPRLRHAPRDHHVHVLHHVSHIKHHPQVAHEAGGRPAGVHVVLRVAQEDAGGGGGSAKVQARTARREGSRQGRQGRHSSVGRRQQQGKQHAQSVQAQARRAAGMPTDTANSSGSGGGSGSGSGGDTHPRRECVRMRHCCHEHFYAARREKSAGR